MSRSRKSDVPGPAPGPKRYEIVLTPTAERGLASLSRPDLRRVDDKILGLAETPHPPGAKKLEGIDNLYRIRAGDHRIVYQIDETHLAVVIVAVGNRRMFTATSDRDPEPTARRSTASVIQLVKALRQVFQSRDLPSSFGGRKFHSSFELFLRLFEFDHHLGRDRRVAEVELADGIDDDQRDGRGA